MFVGGSEAAEHREILAYHLQHPGAGQGHSTHRGDQQKRQGDAYQRCPGLPENMQGRDVANFYFALQGAHRRRVQESKIQTHVEQGDYRGTCDQGQRNRSFADCSTSPEM